MIRNPSWGVMRGMKFNKEFEPKNVNASEYDPIGKFMSTLSKKSSPTRADCEKLFSKFRKGSEEARNELIERHIRLVASIALKFRYSRLPMEDLMAEGIAGLITAIDKFDHERGLKLGTYAAWWIRQRIQKFTSKFSGAVSIPHDAFQGNKRRKGLEAQLQVELGRTPTSSEIMKNLVEDDKPTNRIDMANISATSIDKPINETELTLADILTSEKDEKSSYREGGSLKDDLKVAVDFLDNREKKVISLRFGLDNGSPMKLEEISVKLKVSAERVRQIEARSLRKLRAIILRNGKLDFRKLDQYANLELPGKTEMSPLELVLVHKTAA